MDDPNRAFARGELEVRTSARPASPPLRRRLHVTTDPEAPAPACAATSRDPSDGGGREDYRAGGEGGENERGFFLGVGRSVVSTRSSDKLIRHTVFRPVECRGRSPDIQEPP